MIHIQLGQQKGHVGTDYTLLPNRFLSTGIKYLYSVTNNVPSIKGGKFIGHGLQKVMSHERFKLLWNQIPTYTLLIPVSIGILVTN